MPFAVMHWWIWAVVVVTLCAGALRYGLRDERIAAAGLLGGWIITMAVYGRSSTETEWGIFAVDFVLLAILIYLALISTYYWPMFAASFQLLAVVIHLAAIADATVGGKAYISAEIIFGYLLAGAIAVGVIARWAEQISERRDR
jgi:hypothetical protein